MTKPSEIRKAILEFADTLEEATVNQEDYVGTLSVEEYNSLVRLATDTEMLSRIINEMLGAQEYFDNFGDDEV